MPTEPTILIKADLAATIWYCGVTAFVMSSCGVSDRLQIDRNYQLLVNSRNQKMAGDRIPYPFKFNPSTSVGPSDGSIQDVATTFKNVRGRIPFAQTSHLRTMMIEARNDPNKILAHPCSYDGLSSRLVEEAGFPMIFVSGFVVSSSHGLPDAGYIAMQEMVDKIQEVYRQVSIPIMADGDTGYGSPMNVRRTVESFAAAGAAGVMIEDQTWPKREHHLEPSIRVS